MEGLCMRRVLTICLKNLDFGKIKKKHEKILLNPRGFFFVLYKEEMFTDRATIKS